MSSEINQTLDRIALNTATHNLSVRDKNYKHSKKKKKKRITSTHETRKEDNLLESRVLDTFFSF
jgi:hypothetical protein